MSVDVQQVATGVWFAHTDLVNWVLLTDTDGLTLVDCGYPGQRADVETSVRATGATPEDVRAILVTHAHIDHIGTTSHFADAYAVPVYVHPDEMAHARRESHHSATPLQVMANLWRPGVPGWLAAAMRVGVASKDGVASPSTLPEASPLPVPGAPVAVPTPGHTPGHTAYFVPAAGVVVTGDGLITGHPTSRQSGPQLALPMFDDDRGASVAALDRYAAVEADLLLPGHGPAHHGSVAEAARLARERAVKA